MRLTKYLLVAILLLPFFQSLSAQQASSKSVDQALKEGKIEEQFNIVMTKSGKYQDYKVVKRVWLNKLKSNTIDTLKTLESKLKLTNTEITEQKATIAGLKDSLANTNANLATITEEKNSLSFFGAAITKTTYKTIMWIIVGCLLALLGFFIFKFKNSNTVTLQARKALSETEAEFEEHRRRALEREQKVMRKLQDEINKQRKTGAK